MFDAVEGSKQKKKQVSYWNRYTRQQNEITCKIYSNEGLTEKQLSTVMDIIQNGSFSGMDEKAIVDIIVQQCFTKETTASVRRLNQGKNWIIKICKN